MKRLMFLAAAALLCIPSFAADLNEEAALEPASKKEAVKQELQSHLKFYGFMRNFMAYDTRESSAGTGDLFYYMPLDQNINEYGDDLNAASSFRMLALTTRLGLDVTGYQIGRTKFAAKVETDFYSGLSGSTGTAQLRLRQAYVTMLWDDLGENSSVLVKLGQAWHPMGGDQPHVFSLETGAPFNPFARTPLLQVDYTFSKAFSLTATAVWQMQYTSLGISNTIGADGTPSWSKSADYISNGIIPEFYLGVNYKSKGLLMRLAADVQTIKPRSTGLDGAGVEVKVSDRMTGISEMFYLAYTSKSKMFELKAKTTLSQAGDNMNLLGGYGIATKDASTGAFTYTPIMTSSSWASVSYGKKWQVMLMAGYIKNLGTVKEMYSADGVSVKTTDFTFWNSTGTGVKNLNSLVRVIPAICYNVGKFTIGLEYNITAAQYGDGESYNLHALSTEGLHWITNHRIQNVVKFTF